MAAPGAVLRPGALVAVAVAALVGSCAGGDHPRAARAPAAPLRAPSERCGPPDAPARTLHFETSDGATLDGAIVGSGRAGVVLIHEYPGPMCGWWPYAAYLARHGVRAMAALRRDGARTVALAGASMGGSIAVVAAARLHPAALVDLSGERDTATLTPGIRANAIGAAHGVRAPALFAVARGDRYVSVGDMRSVFNAASSRRKRLVVLPAVAGHGWEMLLGLRTTWSPLARRVAAFVRR
jgi:hypothetical protein